MNTRNGYHPPGPGALDREYGRHGAGVGATDNPAVNPLVNGYGAPSARERERRAGGYGGFYEPGAPSSSALDERRTPSASRARGREVDTGPAPLWGAGSSGREEPRYARRDGDRLGPGGGRFGGQRSTSNDTSRGEPSSAEGYGGGQIDETIRHIQYDWDFMANDECIPVQVGLQLMDTSTLGQADREPDFLETYKKMQMALKSVVNEHHQSFNSSIGTYHKIQTSLQSSQSHIRSLKSSLFETKTGLLTTKPELKGLASASQGYDDVLQLLGKIEHLRTLPEKLEARVSDKRFIAAVEILQDGQQILRLPEFEKLSGLGDMKTYFANQETTLIDILVEELHDHLYLKSPYCQDRWKTPRDNASRTSAAQGGSGERPVYRFLSNLNLTIPLVDDSSSNPEADTFAYIHLLIETLNKMGHIEAVVDRIEQRLPVELYAVVDKTSADVANHHPDHALGVQKKDGRFNNDVEVDVIQEQGHVLAEFLDALYAKFEAIAEGHRVVDDVVAGIVDRENVRKQGSLASGFQELWKLYQSEIRSLLHDYLAMDGTSSFRTAPNGLDQGYSLSSVQRDKAKKLFKLSEVDKNSSDMKSEQQDLDEILRSSVPGLVSKSRQKLTPSDLARSNHESTGTGHKLLIGPSVFNISLLLPPALSFIQRLKSIVPEHTNIDASMLTGFLDDFMINVFQPQLDEAVTDLCTMCFIAPDAYTEDSQWSIYSTKPVFKGTNTFMNLIKRFSTMLDSIPHDQAFTQLLINQIVTYYEKSCGWYKALVSRMSSQHVGGIRLKAAGELVESGKIRDISEKLWESPSEGRHELINEEIDLLINRTNETPLEPYDIVSDRKTVFSLSLLYNSMHWLISSLSKLRHITPHQTDSSRRRSRNMSQLRRWTLSSGSNANQDGTKQTLRLPMTEESVVAFDRILGSLGNLALTALLTLHIDIRCGAIHMVTRSLKGSTITTTTNNNPSMEQPPSSPTRTSSTPAAPTEQRNWSHILLSQPSSASPAILELNNDLISFDSGISTYLGSKEHQFITSGLAKLIDRAFVSGTRFIGAMNSNGALKLQLDVLVLQQNLKNIITSAPTTDAASNTTPTIPPQEVVALPRSAKFLDWFLEGPDKALQYAKEEKEHNGNGNGNGEPFSYDEMKVLIELCFSAVLKGPEGEASREDYLAAKKGSGEALLKLSEVMWDS